ncbi:MAG: DEAD/DEAH box helicase [Ignavibacteria bacterium]|nr:DEAD/DEAH box helicase [Ignavibacteria bacterium]
MVYSLREIAYEIFSESVRLKGYSYFRDRRVGDLDLAGNKVKAVVHGTKDYHVSIVFDALLFPSERSCTCPINGAGDCKHIASVLYLLNSMGFFTSQYYARQIWTALGIDEEEVEQLTSDQSTHIIPDTTPQPKRRRNPQEAVKRLLRKIDDEIEKEHVPEKTRTPEQIAFEERRIEERRKELEEQKEREQLRLFRDRMDRLILPPQKTGKTRYRKEFTLSLSVMNSYRNVSPVVCRYSEQGNFISERELTEKEYLEERGLPDNVALALGFAFRMNGRGVFLPAFGNELAMKDAAVTNSLMCRIFQLMVGQVIRQHEAAHDSPRRFYSQPGEEIRIMAERGEARTSIVKNDDAVLVSLHLTHPQFGKLDLKKAVPITMDPMWFLYERHMFRVEHLTYQQYMVFMVTDGEIRVTGKHIEYLEKHYIPGLPRHMQVESAYYQYQYKEVTPRKKLFLEEREDTIFCRLAIQYDDIEVEATGGEEIQQYVDGIIIRIERIKGFEEAAVQKLRELKMKEKQPSVFIPKESPVDFLIDILPQIAAEGYEIYGEDKLKSFQLYLGMPQLRVFVSSEINWLDVDAQMVFGEESVPLSKLLDAGRNRRYVRLNSGKIARLTESFVAKMQKHLSLATEEDGKLRFSVAQAGAVLAIMEEADEGDSDAAFKKNIARLRDFTSIARQKLPSGLKAKLRTYQKHGLDWFYFLQEFRFGGILADDMGLGKTIQVLTLLLNEKERNAGGPSLVVVPTSVVFNWLKEAERFTPELRILNHTGSGRENESTDHFSDYDIILTSYSIVLRDFELLEKVDFHYIILDESQKIKNPIAKSSRLIRKLHSTFRLCLSGTPVENNLLELWSQMTFLNPGMLGSLQRFQDAFVRTIQREGSDDSTAYLRKLVYPFVLRRTKENVAKELPPRTEIIHYCEMTPEQEELYTAVRDSIRVELMQSIQEHGLQKSGMKIIEGLLRLRQICNHPNLVSSTYNGSCGKFEEFKDMVINVVEEDHKVLIFSQFVKMLELMQKYLNRVSIKHTYLDGSTKDREQIITRFQEDPDIKAFLISLKAGGFGLNLTAADIVFLYDPWWNPAVEKQAADRTHRIGQTKNIFIYKFITKGTVEEKILDLQERKRNLVEKILTTESGLFKSLTQGDIEHLFS